MVRRSQVSGLRKASIEIRNQMVRSERYLRCTFFFLLSSGILAVMFPDRFLIKNCKSCHSLYRSFWPKHHSADPDEETFSRFIKELRKKQDNRPRFLSISTEQDGITSRLQAQNTAAAATVDISMTSQKTVLHRSQSCFRILLIIIFNTAGHYGNVHFLKSLYKRAFRHIVIYGPGNDRPEGVGPSMDESGGFFSS